MKRAARFLAALLCAAALALPAAAQDFDDPISTSRPGFASGTGTVAPRRVQIEVGTPGVSRTTRDLEGSFRGPEGGIITGEAATETRVINFPTLVRVGLLPWLEARASSNVYNFRRFELSGSTGDGGTEVDFENEEGTSRINVGVKARFWEGGGAAPSLSVTPLVTLPVGEPPFTNGEGVGYAATLAAAWSLPAQVGLALDAGLGLTPVDGTDDFIANTTFVGALSRPLTEQLGGYVEGALTLEDGEDEAGYAGAGLTYRIIPTAQLDVFFDRGLNENATDWLFGGGVSIRFGG